MLLQSYMVGHNGGVFFLSETICACKRQSIANDLWASMCTETLSEKFKPRSRCSVESLYQHMLKVVLDSRRECD